LSSISRSINIEESIPLLSSKQLGFILDGKVLSLLCGNCLIVAIFIENLIDCDVKGDS
jgi:hypothetical protein